MHAPFLLNSHVCACAIRLDVSPEKLQKFLANALDSIINFLAKVVGGLLG